VGLLALAGVIAVVAVVFRASLPSSASSVEASQTVTQAAEYAAFAVTIPNTIAASAPSPPGMVWISGGEFSMGALDPPATDQVGMHAAVDARPRRVDGTADALPQ
jgi:formylglycine-generating enzyme